MVRLKIPNIKISGNMIYILLIIVIGTMVIVPIVKTTDMNVKEMFELKRYQNDCGTCTVND